MKEITRLLKKRVLWKGEWGETLGTRKSRKHRHSGIYWTKSKRTSFYKKKANRKVRRNGNISSGNNYRKVYNYRRTID